MSVIRCENMICLNLCQLNVSVSNAVRNRVFERVSAVERRIAINVRAREINGEVVDGDQLDEYYEQRVDAGMQSKLFVCL